MPKIKYTEEKFLELLGTVYGAQEKGGEFYSYDMWEDAIKNYHPQYKEMEVMDPEGYPYIVLY